MKILALQHDKIGLKWYTAARFDHWDTFDNETFFKQDFDTLSEAEEYVAEEYKGRIRSSGADKVDIVNSKGDITRQFNVG